MESKISSEVLPIQPKLLDNEIIATAKYWAGIAKSLNESSNVFPETKITILKEPIEDLPLIHMINNNIHTSDRKQKPRNFEESLINSLYLNIFNSVQSEVQKWDDEKRESKFNISKFGLTFPVRCLEGQVDQTLKEALRDLNSPDQIKLPQNTTTYIDKGLVIVLNLDEDRRLRIIYIGEGINENYFNMLCRFYHLDNNHNLKDKYEFLKGKSVPNTQDFYQAGIIERMI